MNLENRKKILLLGNGINRCFDQDSWKNLVQNILKESGSDVDYEKISTMPFTMQVVVASKDTMDVRLNELAKKLMDTVATEKEKEILQELLKMNFDSILTTNYSYELEQAGGIQKGRNSYLASRNWTKEDIKKKEKKLHLFEYNEAMNNRIWHIHGDVCTPTSMVMGHYYYGKLLSSIEYYSSGIKKRVEDVRPFEYLSWVDYFTLSDIDIVGFGYDLSEADLWWLLCYKHRNFPTTKVTFYIPYKDLEDDKRLLLKTYGVTIRDDIELKGEDYLDYYCRVIEDLRKAIHE